MQPQTYQQFAKMNKDQQLQFVNNKKQSAPGPFPEPTTFPQINFVALNGVQDKKAIKLATYRYPAQKPKGVVIIYHSMGYHINMYSNVAKVLANNGFTVVGFDQRGHGKSQGQRGYLDDATKIMDDSRTFIGTVFKTYPDLPVFLLGHGPGALIALNSLLQFKQFKLAGIILTSTALKRPAHSKVLSALSDVAFKLMPNKTGLFQPSLQLITSNPKVCEYIQKDPNAYHGKVYVGTLSQLMQLMQRIDQKTWKKIDTPPIVIVQGQFDKVADPINAINFYESIKSKDKQFWWYNNMWNNWFFEPQADQINNRIVKWLTSKL